MQDEYILITGGAGYIGSHTNLELSKRGHKTIVFDNLVYGHRELAKWGKLIVGDLNSLEELRAVFREHKIRAVVHFAAYAYVGESVTDPQKYYTNNVANTLNLLKVMREFNVDKIVFSSTCAVYGTPDQVPINESCKTAPINPYGMGKLMVETILADYSRAYGMKYVSLRYFNAAGADPDGQTGECHSPETHLIPLAIEAATQPNFSLQVFGTDYPTPDGTCVRDYIHVTDLADAHVRALEYLGENDSSSDIFNLGNNNGHSVMEVIQSVQKITGKEVKYRMVSRRPGDPAILISNSAKIGKILGWKPRFPELDVIISTAWDWHKNHIPLTDSPEPRQ